MKRPATHAELWGALFEAVTEKVACRVADKLRAGAKPDWFDQHNSPAGNRKHCGITRARIAAGKPGAVFVGRRALLSREAIEEELAALPKRKRKKVSAADDAADLAAELGLKLVKGGKR